MQEPTNNQAPLPGGKQCFNCGKELQNDVALCPHCGAPLPTQGSGFKIVLRLIGVMLLGGLALLLGASGACFMLFATIKGFNGGVSDDLGLAFIGLILFAFAGLCIWGIIALTKKRKI
ncbi:MAG TPA: zinc-ribbon domain-containing protein [Abditibacteriaceae bacterium]|jgi:hypothetical protein